NAPSRYLVFVALWLNVQPPFPDRFWSTELQSGGRLTRPRLLLELNCYRLRGAICQSDLDDITTCGSPDLSCIELAGPVIGHEFESSRLSNERRNIATRDPVGRRS